MSLAPILLVVFFLIIILVAVGAGLYLLYSTHVCTTARDCPGSQLCNNGRCGPAMQCNADTECPVNQTCNNGSCTGSGIPPSLNFAVFSDSLIAGKASPYGPNHTSIGSQYIIQTSSVITTSGPFNIEFNYYNPSTTVDNENIEVFLVQVTSSENIIPPSSFPYPTYYAANFQSDPSRTSQHFCSLIPTSAGTWYIIAVVSGGTDKVRAYLDLKLSVPTDDFTCSPITT